MHPSPTINSTNYSFFKSRFSVNKLILFDYTALTEKSPHHTYILRMSNYITFSFIFKTKFYWIELYVSFAVLQTNYANTFISRENATEYIFR